jgi:two-component system OmpR family response regulator
MNILIVEDNEETLSFLQSSLEEEGFVVDVATDGRAGSSKARNKNYDVIILDNMLPQKDGLQVCSEIRAAGKSVPIIMLSVRSEVATKVELLNAGVDDYLTKPFVFKELLARIKALLRRPKKVERKVLKVGDLILDMQRHSITRGSKEIRLSPKELVLLEYLIRNRGLVISRVSLFEHVWDMNVDPCTNTIEAHIFNLRKKINQKGKRELIHTISGVGYKIE